MIGIVKAIDLHAFVTLHCTISVSCRSVRTRFPQLGVLRIRYDLRMWLQV